MAKNLTVLVFVFLENKWSKQIWTLENFYKLDQLRRNSNTVVAAVGVPVVAVVLPLLLSLLVLLLLLLLLSLL